MDGWMDEGLSSLFPFPFPLPFRIIIIISVESSSVAAVGAMDSLSLPSSPPSYTVAYVQQQYMGIY